MHRSPARRGSDESPPGTLLVASPTRLEDLDGREAALDLCDVVELRADLLGDDLPTDELRSRFGGRLLFTLRSRAEGGAAHLDAAERRRRLTEAASRYDLVDLEVERDGVDSELLAAVPPERRVLSWHGRFGEPADLGRLREILRRQRALGAAYYKLVAAAETPSEAVPSLQLQVREGGAGRLTSFAMGETAAWSRIVAARRGSALTFGSCGSSVSAAGQVTVRDLVRDYQLQRPSRPQRLMAVLGWPVTASLSPRLHNGAYADLGLDALFLAIGCPDLDEVLGMLRSPAFAELELELGGFAVTTPHKDAALAAGERSERAEMVGAANTLLLGEGGWRCHSTDPEGVVEPLRRRLGPLNGVRAAVLGAGGAGRAAVVGLREAGAEVVLANRSAERGERAATRLGVPFVPLTDLDAGGLGVVVNATSLGRGDDDPLPLDPATLCDACTVVDMVYRGESATPLLAAARRRGLATVDGREVLLFQGVEQFRLMNGADLDLEAAAGRLGVELATRDGAS